MDDYWMKSEKKEVAAKKLDEDMDAYWEKKGQSTEAADKSEEANDGEAAEAESEEPAAETS
jgi:hypothetical protein